MASRVPSYSKINLGLAIGPLREDGFHALVTVYQTLGLCDFVTVSARRSRRRARATRTVISLRSNEKRVPRDERNTAWKMVALALERAGIAAEVEIEIEKNLPVQGGLGAGSGNAAAALIGLEEELGLRLDEAARLEIAAEVGSDVPLFLIGGTVLGVGRGEEVSALPDLPVMDCVVAVPEVGVSTPQAFKDWDALDDGGKLTVEAASDRLNTLSRAISAGFSGVSAVGGDLAGNPLLELVRTGIENDFERVVFPIHPRLREIKQVLEVGALYAALSGSGSALFGLYADERMAGEAAARVGEMGVKVLVGKTVGRRALAS
jgi:4-diphosphocytidyl-2-C-methyl-D-erythritol kinase